MSAAGENAFLKRRPVVCLLLLAPGVPKCLSGSGPLSAVVLSPATFLPQMAANWAPGPRAPSPGLF